MIAALTLTRDEVVELTGYKRPSEQIEWLRRQGIAHFVAGDGRPRIIREALLQCKETPHSAPRLRLPT